MTEKRVGIVTTAVKGCEDGNPLPRSFRPGDVVHGDLAKALIDGGYASEDDGTGQGSQSDSPPADPDKDRAPQTENAGAATKNEDASGKGKGKGAAKTA